ncbi:MAG: hypothetical protein ABW000_01335 [Actinoplanes sp.]
MTTTATATTSQTGARIAGVLAALLLGALTALAGARIANAVAPDPDVDAIAAMVYPGTPVVAEHDPWAFAAEDEPGWLRFLKGRDNDVEQWSAGPRDQAILFDNEAYRAAARQRVTDAGWTTHDGIQDSLAFWAVKGDVRFDFYADVMHAPEIPTGIHTNVYVMKVQPWWATLVSLLGGLTGAWAGWLLAGWVSRRAAPHSSARRTVIREGTVIAFVLASPLWLQTVLLVVGGATRTEVPEIPVVGGLARWPAGPALLLFLVVIAVAVRPAAPRPPVR